jgi:hypothetical protein
MAALYVPSDRSDHGYAHVALGLLLTLVLPEAASRSLEKISGEAKVIAAAEQVATTLPSRLRPNHSRASGPAAIPGTSPLRTLR